ncbi:hypothetical protein FACS1894182_13410 [Bacteroidia bacterium]|nr:hypothetical protein FACS1894182_13410 [Bacteroidia bacterium]
MYIQLKDIKTISGPLAHAFELPSNIIRIIEFEEVVVVLLDEDGKQDKIIGVKFTKEGGIHRYHIGWEFQIIDKLGRTYGFDYMVRKNHKGQDLLVCMSGCVDMEYYLNPDTGEVLDKVFSKG